MNTEALILLLVLLAGMLTFSYQGYRMLYDPEASRISRSPAGPARHRTIKLKNADAAGSRRVTERSSYQFSSADNEAIKQREKSCPVCEKKYPEEDKYCGDDGSVLEYA